ncbi:MAG: SAM hydrolase/SAM-dependent halogenase family protein [Candidatus Asgardarchaeia archaeon]
MRYEYITLLTDFGLKEEAVGVMKGVIYSIVPEVKMIDITHNVQSFNVLDGAWLLKLALNYMPIAVHVAVVDPGVGTERRAIAVETGRGDVLIGPDNGLLIPSIEELGFKRCFEICEKKYMLEHVSSIFHGRDVFAPAGAWAAYGIDISEFGPELKMDELKKLDSLKLKTFDGKVLGTATHVSKFGNIYTNIPIKMLKELGMEIGSKGKIEVRGREFGFRYVKSFGYGKEDELITVDDSYGNVLIAKNQDFANDYVKVKIGDEIIVKKDDQ